MCELQFNIQSFITNLVFVLWFSLGYINNKQKSHGGGFAQPNSKKSLYAVMDVVQALNSHQSFIPYRKSKVTHILQDSLCKTSGALLIACLVRVLGVDILYDLFLLEDF